MSILETAKQVVALDQKQFTEDDPYAESLDEILNGPDWKKRKGNQIGFFLAMYPMGEEGRFNYISNSDKLDVRAMLKEIIARIEGRLSQSGQA